ncbi:MAG: PD-(D/E)XK nuclease family protein [Patescibacteria group bacterium]|nr:PD-(D/E)XK nuclease family protein [Patescibacteria group bacterium]MDE2116334.1 PD-(D/E)XK nuclease family protein [Patescibacteria group bacterium]
MECPRCFYLDNKLGVARPKGPSFTLNVAVDALLKKEFDAHRIAGRPHPLMTKYGVDAIPFKHDELAEWQENFVGIQYRHPESGMLITGAIDDVWINKKGELIVVDYKATAKDGKIESLEDTKWQNQYKRQMEVYQWLLRRKGYRVAETGYFVYVNGRKDRPSFDGKLEFDVTLIAHKGDDSWVEKTIVQARACLDSDALPEPSSTCEFCVYRKAARDVQMPFMSIKKTKTKTDATGNKTDSLF